VQLIGRWKRGFARPLWVMTSLQPQQGLALYLQRMKIEESFRDLKSLLGLHKVMNKSQQNMEQMVALLMIAYAIGLLIGEAIRDQLFAETVNRPQTPSTPASAQQAVVNKGKKWKLYSGLFILLKQKIHLSAREIRRIVRRVLESFVRLVQHPVRTNV
jgi:transposase